MYGRCTSLLSHHIAPGVPSPGAQPVLQFIVKHKSKMSFSSAQGVEVKGNTDDPNVKEILTSDALGFVAKLHRHFNPTRLQILKAREERYVIIF